MIAARFIGSLLYLISCEVTKESDTIHGVDFQHRHGSKVSIHDVNGEHSHLLHHATILQQWSHTQIPPYTCIKLFHVHFHPPTPHVTLEKFWQINTNPSCLPNHTNFILLGAWYFSLISLPSRFLKGNNPPSLFFPPKFDVLKFHLQIYTDRSISNVRCLSWN